jgi:hypothetical protein
MLYAVYALIAILGLISCAFVCAVVFDILKQIHIRFARGRPVGKAGPGK